MSYKKKGYLITLIIASLIALDFTLPGSSLNLEINEVERSRQQYYNAARNHHYSFIIHTDEHSFPVSSSFIEDSMVGQKIYYTVSLIFSEVNRYRMVESDSSEIYSLRWLSGLILPVLTILVMLLAFRYENRLELLSFIFQVLILTDFLFVIF
ncbi:MAG: hypothetical protein HKN45_03595 [Flavobacteriales bacterium]|nr:hypothetical protein [Flavobacteriales bacterium]